MQVQLSESEDLVDLYATLHVVLRGLTNCCVSTSSHCCTWGTASLPLKKVRWFSPLSLLQSPVQGQHSHAAVALLVFRHVQATPAHESESTFYLRCFASTCIAKVLFPK